MRKQYGSGLTVTNVIFGSCNNKLIAKPCINFDPRPSLCAFVPNLCAKYFFIVFSEDYNLCFILIYHLLIIKDLKYFLGNFEDYIL